MIRMTDSELLYCEYGECPVPTPIEEPKEDARYDESKFLEPPRNYYDDPYDGDDFRGDFDQFDGPRGPGRNFVDGPGPNEQNDNAKQDGSENEDASDGDEKDN